MYKITGADGKEYGPFPAEQVRELIAANSANAQTLAQAEGATDRKPLSAFPEFADALAAREKEKSAPPPLAAGAAPPALPVNADALADEILGRDFSVDIGRCVGRGWDLVRENFWLLVGATAMAWLIAGSVFFLYGPVYGGLYGLFLKLLRHEKAEFGDMFTGFSLAFLPLFLVGLVKMLLVGAGLFLCLLPGIFLAVVWIFALPLALDKRMDFWPAMELSRKVVMRHWWSIFGLLLVNALLTLLGEAACFIGVFVAMPITVGAVACAYEDIFGTPQSPAA